MKMNKRPLSIFIVAIMLITLLPVQVLGAGVIDLERSNSLTVSYQYEGKAIVGADFEVYFVASVDENGKLAISGEFSEYHVDILNGDDTSWGGLASTLEGLVLRDHVVPVRREKTGEDGMAVFANLPQGLYLVRGGRHTNNEKVYNTVPLMVMLPSLDEESDDWRYDVKVNCKPGSELEPDGDIIKLKVLKIWDDEGFEDERPETIVVHLLCDGEIYDTVTLSKENNWRYTWDDLDADHHWLVVEDDVEDYTAEITRTGITFVIKNSYDDEPDKPDKPDDPVKPPKLPQTGQLWWPVPVLLASGLLSIVIGLIRRRGESYEE